MDVDNIGNVSCLAQYPYIVVSVDVISHGVDEKRAVLKLVSPENS